MVLTSACFAAVLALGLVVPTTPPSTASLLAPDVKIDAKELAGTNDTSELPPQGESKAERVSAHEGLEASPPPACFSHDVYVSVGQAFIAYNETIAAAAAKPASELASEIVILSIIGGMGIALLVYGTRFTTCALSIVLFMIVFTFSFAVLDAAAYSANRSESFGMCVMPLMMALLFSLLLSVLSLCLVQRVPWIAFFSLGAALGAVATYLLRGAILAANPALATTAAFGWYWLGAVLLTVLAGVTTACLRKAMFVATCVIVGAFAIATFVAGIVPVSGGQPIGFGLYLVVLLSAACLGVLIQYCGSSPESDRGGSDAAAKSDALLDK